MKVEGNSERVELKEACSFALEEARTVVPGVQALLGFQLIAVFSERFDTALTEPEKALHLVAVLLGALACALLVAPAAYHRRMGLDQVSPDLLKVISNFVWWAMVALMLSLSLEVYIVSMMIFDRISLGIVLACVALFTFFWAWILFPAITSRHTKKHASRTVATGA